MKIIHIADIHFDEANQEAALKSLTELATIGSQEKVDLFAIAGDLFNSSVQNNDVLIRLVTAIKELLRIAPVVAVKGTPTHDVGDCYDIFDHIDASRKFTLLKPGLPYFLIGSNINEYPMTGDGLLILGCPEPSKSWFLKGRRMGREEANQAIIEGMRGILLGCGALRKQYPDIPCLFVYHGSVVGATMCNGQKMRPGEIEIGRDDLSLVGADYYALGHIHLSQQIEGLTALYSGSAYPGNWGECDLKKFNVVDIKLKNQSVVKQFPFPHPPRKKISLDFDDVEQNLDDKDYVGYQAWIDIRGKEKQDPTNCEILLQSMLKDGALPGSRVTYTRIATETTRAAEITEKHSLPEKIKIWGKSSNKEIRDSVLEKAGKLEAEARREGAITNGAWIRFDKLRLRGAIGIYDARGIDEVEIDFENFDEGLIALIGETGSGKTTIIDNCQPFLELPSRSGKLQDHFRLKDSYRDLYFTDERAETAYRAFTLIDGVGKKIEPMLYKKEKGAENYEPVTNGRVADYEQKIKQIFGSIDIFKRSAFAAQDQTQRLDKCTKGEKKTLYLELSGLDHYKIYAENAKSKAQESEKIITDHKANVRAIEPGCLTYEQEKMRYNQEQENLKIKKGNLIEIEANGRFLKEKLNNLEAKVKEQAIIKERIKNLDSQIIITGSDLELASKFIRDLEGKIAFKSDVEKLIANYDKLEEEYKTTKEDLEKLDEERNKKLKKYWDEKTAYDISLREIDNKIYDVRFQLRSSNAKLRDLEDKIADQYSLLSEKVKCQKCQELFAIDEEKINNTILVFAKQRDNASSEIAHWEKELSFMLDRKSKLGEEPKKPEDQAAEVFLIGEVDRLKKQLSLIDIKTLRERVQTARDAQIKITSIKEQQEKLKEKKDALNKELRAEILRIDTDIEESYISTKNHYEIAREDYQAASKEIVVLEMILKVLGEKIHDIANKIMELNYIKEKMEDEEKELAEWYLLERACGADGMQALELDALAPNISAEVNSLLESAFGSRFRVEIRTTREAGKGSKTHQVEDFQIWIHDERKDYDKLLENMSGGEKVLITRTISDAFGIINDKNTGTRYLTYFMDEADDGLDPEMRQHYFRIMEAAHDNAHRRQTIVITHSRDIQQIIQQKIIMNELKEATN